MASISGDSSRSSTAGKPASARATSVVDVPNPYPSPNQPKAPGSEFAPVKKSGPVMAGSPAYVVSSVRLSSAGAGSKRGLESHGSDVSELKRLKNEHKEMKMEMSFKDQQISLLKNEIGGLHSQVESLNAQVKGLTTRKLELTTSLCKEVSTSRNLALEVFYAKNTIKDLVDLVRDSNTLNRICRCFDCFNCDRLDKTVFIGTGCEWVSNRECKMVKKIEDRFKKFNITFGYLNSAARKSEKKTNIFDVTYYDLDCSIVISAPESNAWEICGFGAKIGMLLTVDDLPATAFAVFMDRLRELKKKTEVETDTEVCEKCKSMEACTCDDESACGSFSDGFNDDKNYFDYADDAAVDGEPECVYECLLVLSIFLVYMLCFFCIVLQPSLPCLTQSTLIFPCRMPRELCRLRRRLLRRRRRQLRLHGRPQLRLLLLLRRRREGPLGPAGLLSSCRIHPRRCSTTTQPRLELWSGS